MSDDLCSRSCVPCRGDTPRLSGSEVEALLPELPGWVLADDGRQLRRRFSFPDFAAALAFVSRLGALAESEDHHPDIAFGWGWAEIVWTTHAIGGLHANDFIMAARTGRLLAE